MILRRSPRARFTTLPTALVEDSRLTYEALGVLVYLLSRPDDWTIHLNQLAGTRDHRVGRDRMRRIVNELIAAGYICRVARRGENGRIAGAEYVVTDQPAGSAAQRKATPAPENPAPVNPPLLKTERDLSPLYPPEARGEAAGREEETTSPPVPTFDQAAGRWKREARSNAATAKARHAWAGLGAADRIAATEAIPRWFASWRDSGRGGRPLAFAAYLAGRNWIYLPPPAEADTPPALTGTPPGVPRRSTQQASHRSLQ